MKSPLARSISLTYDQVCDLVEAWLNDNLLRSPHHVVDIDLIDGQQFNISLEAPYGPAVDECAGLIAGGASAGDRTATLPPGPYTISGPAPFTAPANGNGHQPARRPGGQPALSAADIEFVRQHTDWTARTLGEKLGYPTTTIAPYLTRARKEAQHAAASAQPFPGADRPGEDTLVDTVA